MRGHDRATNTVLRFVLFKCNGKSLKGLKQGEGVIRVVFREAHTGCGGGTGLKEARIPGVEGGTPCCCLQVPSVGLVSISTFSFFLFI